MKPPSFPMPMDCTGCALCESVCPIFRRDMLAWHGPKGMLVNIQLYQKGILDNSQLGQSLKNCLLCGKCQTACPASLPLTTIFFYGKLEAEKKWKLPRQINQKISEPLFNLAGPLLENWKKDQDAAFFAKIKKYRPFLTRRPKKNPAAKRVLLFPGCSVRQKQPEIARACVKALAIHGYEVISPFALTCCGKKAGHDRKAFLKSVRHNLRVLAKEDFEALLTPCPSCLWTLREIWPKITELNEHERKLAQNLANKSAYISSYLNIPGQNKKHGQILWHEACSITEQDSLITRQLLGLDKSYFSGQCCGASCKAQVLNGKADSKMRKIAVPDFYDGQDHLTANQKMAKNCRNEMAALKPDIVVTPCPDCVLALNQEFAREKDSQRAIHAMIYYENFME